MQLSLHPGASQVRMALAWGRGQAGDADATALAERAAALVLTSAMLPADASWARELARRAAAGHIAFAALFRVIAAIEERAGRLTGSPPNRHLA